MGFLNQLGNIQNLIPGQQKRAGFQRVYNKTDFGLTANVTCKAGQWNKLASKTVPAQQLLAFGYGTETLPHSAGRLYAYLQDGVSGEIKGKLRLLISDANELVKTTVYEGRTDILHGSATDKEMMVVLPEFRPMAKEDSKLILEFYSDESSADCTVDYSKTTINVPVTVYQ